MTRRRHVETTNQRAFAQTGSGLERKAFRVDSESDLNLQRPWTLVLTTHGTWRKYWLKGDSSQLQNIELYGDLRQFDLVAQLMQTKSHQVSLRMFKAHK